MNKTGTEKSIKIVDKAHLILAHYRKGKNNPEDFIFPLLDNDKDYSDQAFLYQQISAKTALVNKYLKKLAEKAEIHKSLSFHIARHTFANAARRKIKDMSKIQTMMGHGSLKTLEEYIEDLEDLSLDNDSEAIFI